jgi:hypothetical protein
VKLPAHRAGLPGKVILFYIVPLDPAYKAGLAGHVPVKTCVLLAEPVYRFVLTSVHGKEGSSNSITAIWKRGDVLLTLSGPKSISTAFTREFLGKVMKRLKWGPSERL